METKEAIQKTKNDDFHFQPEEIPSEILGIKLSDENIKRLQRGDKSSLLENLQDKDGNIFDSKIHLSRDKQNNPKVNFSIKKQNLEIPDEIIGESLNSQQKKDLQAGRTVGPFNYKSNDLYLKVDPELNRVIVSTGKELSIPNEIGDYKLTEKEKEKLANKEQLPTKVLKGDDGFFLAKINITEDDKGIVFNDIKEISPEKAKELKPELNNADKSNLLNNIISSANNINAEKQQQFNFNTLLENKDYKSLENLKNNNFTPTNEDLNNLLTNNNLSKEEKINVASIFEKEEFIIKSQKSNTIDNIGPNLNKSSKENITSKNIEKPDTKKVTNNNLVLNDEKEISPEKSKELNSPKKNNLYNNVISSTNLISAEKSNSKSASVDEIDKTSAKNSKAKKDPKKGNPEKKNKKEQAAKDAISSFFDQ